jgi:hypothetical protein
MASFGGEVILEEWDGQKEDEAYKLEVLDGDEYIKISDDNQTDICQIPTAERVVFRGFGASFHNYTCEHNGTKEIYGIDRNIYSCEEVRYSGPDVTSRFTATLTSLINDNNVSCSIKALIAKEDLRGDDSLYEERVYTIKKSSGNWESLAHEITKYAKHSDDDIWTDVKKYEIKQEPNDYFQPILKEDKVTATSPLFSRVITYQVYQSINTNHWYPVIKHYLENRDSDPYDSKEIIYKDTYYPDGDMVPEHKNYTQIVCKDSVCTETTSVDPRY